MLLEGLPKMILSKTINFVYNLPFYPSLLQTELIVHYYHLFPALPKSLSRHMEGFTTFTASAKQVSMYTHFQYPKQIFIHMLFICRHCDSLHLLFCWDAFLFFMQGNICALVGLISHFFFG